MVALNRELEKTLTKEKAVFIEFNAWKFQDREAIWRALILHLLAEFRKNGGDSKKIDQLELALYQAFSFEEKGTWKVNWRTVIVESISLILSAVKLDFVAKAIKGSSGWLARLFGLDDDNKKSKGNNTGIIDQKRIERIASVLERTSVERHVQQIKSIEQFLDEFLKMIHDLTTKGRRIFVFIDDLDRCLPESALEIFESIKLFLDAPGVGYVVA